MNNLFELENQFLNAKHMYYIGTPIMSDAEFDALEKVLKDNNSNVVNQVGYKIKDFDFAHYTKMLSLAKIQTEKNEDGTTNYMFNEFMNWYIPRSKKVENKIIRDSPKFDGNAINVTYIGGIFTEVVTRGDGSNGKNITDFMRSKFPKQILHDKSFTLDSDDVLEIRGEVVIDKNLFNEKYAPLGAANPRNYVAGVLGGDDVTEEKITELVFLPYHFILNGIHVSPEIFIDNEFVASTRYERDCDANDFVSIIQYYENIRDKFQFQLDGVVFAFYAEEREALGQNSHDPEWSIAIKFIPEEAVTEVIGVEWNVGKTGELAPVILLKPVQLAGTTVQRASGFNYGNVLNGLGKGAMVMLVKSGDIIPDIQQVIVPSNDFSIIPTTCPICGEELTIDGLHLMCNNETCPGRISKQFSTNAKMIDIKGIGSKTFEKFAFDFKDLVDLIYWVKTKGDTSDIEKYGIAFKSRTHEIFLNAFRQIKSLSYGQVIVMLGYNNVGLKLADQIANMYNGIEPDFTSQDRSLVEMLSNEFVHAYINTKVDKLKECGVNVIVPFKKEINMNAIYVCMTGSPKEFGFATKSDFVKAFDGELIDVSLSDKNCKYLITDDYSSTSSKMKTAQKKGIKILTYGDFMTEF